MFNTASFTPPAFHSGMAISLPNTCFTSFASLLLGFVTNRFGRVLLLAIVAGLATACSSETNTEQPITNASSPVAEAATEDAASPDDDDDDCRKMQDMWDSLPKLETYKQFKRTERVCLPVSGAISYKFNISDDNEALMSVALWDVNKDSNENAFLKKAKELEGLTTNPNSGVRKGKLGVGEIPTVSGAVITEKVSGGKYVCLFKGHYYFEILVSLPGKSLAKPEAVENFVKEYVKQIDPSKLK